MSGRNRGDDLEDQGLEVKRYDFVLQFVWKPTSPGAIELVPETNDEMAAY